MLAIRNVLMLPRPLSESIKSLRMNQLSWNIRQTHPQKKNPNPVSDWDCVSWGWT